MLVKQPISISRAVSVSGLDLLLALTEAQLLSNFEAMLGHCCPLCKSQLLDLVLQLAGGFWTVHRHSGGSFQGSV